MRAFSGLALIVSLLSGASVLAAEGMWLPSQTGKIAQPLREAGLALDPVTLGDLTQPPLTAIVSLGGCSAAFLSPQGLVATNHHCVHGSIQYNSKPGQDYLADGFLAARLKDELPAAPGSRIYVIEDLRDVTAAMMAGVTVLQGRARHERLEANRKELIRTCEEQLSRRCDVRSYFGGATYYLQQQLEIKDVRLVYAPAGGTGNFGGEVDNWQWPRHTGDFGFYRAYVAPDGSSAPFAKDNIPYKPKAWLPVAKDGVKDGDFVMVAGFPGTTERHRLAEEARFYYTTLYPLQQKLLAEYSEAITAATAGNEDASIKYASILKRADNYKKKLLGQMAGAEAVGLIGKKAADEKAFRAWVLADGKRRARYGAALVALDKAVAVETAATLVEARANLLGRAQLLAAARTLYRWSKEQEKPDAAREPGYQERDRRFIEEQLTALERRFVPKIDRILFEKALAEYRQLPPADRSAALEQGLARIGLEALYATTKLGDLATRKAWLDKKPAEFEASTDPFLQLAVAMFPEDIAGENAKKARSGDGQKARSRVMEARLAYAASQGKTLYPDANGSLRFTYGHVQGRVRDGMTWTPFTTAEGLVEKQTGREPFNAPVRAIAAIKAKDYGRYAAPDLGTLPVDFLSTVDITNGNSGSSTLNARGEFVGLAFDGTLDGVISDWWYESSLNRTIHVDSRYMLWTMDKIDGAARLLKEMAAE